jgi:hypothetical protein
MFARHEDNAAEDTVQRNPPTEAHAMLNHTDTDLEEHNFKEGRPNENSEPEWNPQFMQIRPVAEIFALARVCGCLLASLAILAASNNQPVSSWTVQPTVYLAIASAAGAAAIRFAKDRAEPVAWWNRALHGSTIHALDSQWEARQGIWGA